MKRNTVFAIIVFVLALSSIVATGLYFYINYDVRDGYDQRRAVVLLISYMKDHNGKWPANWEALEEHYNCCYKHARGPFDAYRKR